jgi:hypothetical protein
MTEIATSKPPANSEALPGRTFSISADKAFELEFGFARDEIRARMDYNRRLLATQITLIAAAVAASLSFTTKAGLPPFLVLQIMSTVLVWMNMAFYLRILPTTLT